MKLLASSFADLADLEAFRICKSHGLTDNQCFAHGDNGIGCYGDNTAQEDVPMCALHHTVLAGKFHSIHAAKHAPVRVTVGDKSVDCILADLCGVDTRVDLNPAACKALGLTPPVLVPANVEWLS